MRHAVMMTFLATATPIQAAGIDASGAADVVRAWSDAVVSGDPARVDAILAPEFQILRGSGAHMDHAGYVASDLPEIAEPPGFELLQATEADGVMVVSYILNIDATVDGQVMQRRAPRLTVFRKIEGDWYVVSHANFGVTQ